MVGTLGRFRVWAGTFFREGPVRKLLPDFYFFEWILRGRKHTFQGTIPGGGLVRQSKLVKAVRNSKRQSPNSKEISNSKIQGKAFKASSGVFGNSPKSLINRGSIFPVKAGQGFRNSNLQTPKSNENPNSKRQDTPSRRVRGCLGQSCKMLIINDAIGRVKASQGLECSSLRTRNFEGSQKCKLPRRRWRLTGFMILDREVWDGKAASCSGSGKKCLHLTNGRLAAVQRLASLIPRDE